MLTNTMNETIRPVLEIPARFSLSTSNDVQHYQVMHNQ
jgi:hypothetical protein